MVLSDELFAHLARNLLHLVPIWNPHGHNGNTGQQWEKSHSPQMVNGSLLVPLAGLEPATYWVETSCSIH